MGPFSAQSYSKPLRGPGHGNHRALRSQGTEGRRQQLDSGLVRKGGSKETLVRKRKRQPLARTRTAEEPPSHDGRRLGRTCAFSRTRSPLVPTLPRRGRSQTPSHSTGARGIAFELPLALEEAPPADARVMAEGGRFHPPAVAGPAARRPRLPAQASAVLLCGCSRRWDRARRALRGRKGFGGRAHARSSVPALEQAKRSLQPPSPPTPVQALPSAEGFT